MIILPFVAYYIKCLLVNKEELYFTMSSRSIYRLVWIFSAIGYQSKYKVIVWDPPNYITKFNSQSFGWVNKLDHFFFNQAIEKAELVITMGNRMNKVLGISNLTNIACCKGVTEYCPGTLQSLTEATGFKIVFAGSIYAKDTWNSFIKAIASVNWSVAGIPLKLIYVGTPSFHGVNIPDQVICTGKMGHKKTMEIISNAHFGYAPYSFGMSFRDASAASFPGKVVDYITSGIPMIYHGPEESEVNDVILRTGGGISINTKDKNDILKAINEAVQRYTELRAETKKVHEKELGFIYEAKN